MITLAVLALALCGSGRALTPTVDCDLIEFHTHTGSDFTQVIFWHWNATDCRYDVRCWLPADQVQQLGPNRVIVEHWVVRGPIRFTRTPQDPERINAQVCFERLAMPWAQRRTKAGFQIYMGASP